MFQMQTHAYDVDIYTTQPGDCILLNDLIAEIQKHPFYTADYQNICVCPWRVVLLHVQKLSKHC